MSTCLVIGGTGPTGPHLVNGLLDRAYEVTILHGGHHEVEFVRSVEHIHTDPHFAATLEVALAGRRFDLVIATYGRVRVIADVVRGRTERLVTVSASAYAPLGDERWGRLGNPVLLPESSPMVDDPASPGLPFKVWQTEQEVLRFHGAGDYAATIVKYPSVYGPNAPANPDWRVVRRILDGRRHHIVGSGGHEIRTRGFAANLAHAILLAVDQPEVANGQVYNVADATQYSQRQIVDHIATFLRHELLLVEVPSEIAQKVHRHQLGEYRTRVLDTTKIVTQLGYQDIVDPADAIAENVEWLCANPPTMGGELERQLGDPFDYALEDEVIRIYGLALQEARALPSKVGTAPHMYRHPRRPGETWSERDGAPGAEETST